MHHHASQLWGHTAAGTGPQAFCQNWQGGRWLQRHTRLWPTWPAMESPLAGPALAFLAGGSSSSLSQGGLMANLADTSIATVSAPLLLLLLHEWLGLLPPWPPAWHGLAVSSNFPEARTVQAFEKGRAHSLPGHAQQSQH
jgi:hypothetical protein